MEAVIFLNGEYNYKKDFFGSIIRKDTEIFCADGGTNYCFSYGYMPDFVFGDMDSIKPDILEEINKKNVKIFKYPPEKDYSDYELILEKMNYEKYTKIYVLGALGGRIDFSLNNIFLLENYKNIEIITKDEIIFFKDKPFSIKNKKNYSFSMVSLDEKIEGITLEGFKYPLFEREIKRATSILMSNEIVSHEAIISFKKGKIICILRKL